MRNFLIILLSITAISVFAQGSLPQNRNVVSPTEYALLASASNGIPSDIFMFHASANSTMDQLRISEKKNELHDFISGITRRYTKEIHTPQLLRNVFYKTHQKYLRNYQSYTTFGDLLENGNYDCLTGTILYAWMLKELGFDFKVIETSHHIYLIIDTDQGPFMFESTDALNGFVAGSESIESRIAGFESDSQRSDDLISEINEEVTFLELVGLQYYNSSVQAYNQQQFINAVDQIEKASLFYKGARLKEFGQILARAIVASDMSQSDKNAYLMKLNTTFSRDVIIASINEKGYELPPFDFFSWIPDLTPALMAVCLRMLLWRFSYHLFLYQQDSP